MRLILAIICCMSVSVFADKSDKTSTPPAKSQYSPSNSLVWGTEFASSVARRRVFVRLRDEQGNNVTRSANAVVRASLKRGGKKGTERPVNVFDLQDGVYALTFTPEVAGKHRLSINVDGVAVSGSPFAMQLVPETCDCPLSSAEFEAAFGCGPLDQQIVKDFASWDKIREEHTKPPHRFAETVYRRHTIVDNQLYSSGSEQGLSPMIEGWFLSLLRKVKLPDVEFQLNYADSPVTLYPTADHSKRVTAVFGWCGTEKHQEIMIPTWDYHSFALNQKYDTLDIEAKTPEWTSKIEKVVWRGGDFGDNGRRPFVQIAQKHPDLFDAGFYYAHQWDEKLLGPKYSAIPFHDFFRYKYVMNVDGAAAAYRLPFLFSGGSLVFWQESPFFEHIYSHFQPNVHYLPVKRDFSDLIEKVQWAKTHDAKARTIAENGRKLARQLITPEQAYCYTYQALTEYAKRQAFTPTIRAGMKKADQPENSRGSNCKCPDFSRLGHQKANETSTASSAAATTSTAAATAATATETVTARAGEHSSQIEPQHQASVAQSENSKLLSRLADDIASLKQRDKQNDANVQTLKQQLQTLEEGLAQIRRTLAVLTSGQPGQPGHQQQQQPSHSISDEKRASLREKRAVLQARMIAQEKTLEATKAEIAALEVELLHLAKRAFVKDATVQVAALASDSTAFLG